MEQLGKLKINELDFQTQMYFLEPMRAFCKYNDINTNTWQFKKFINDNQLNLDKMSARQFSG